MTVPTIIVDALAPAAGVDLAPDDGPFAIAMRALTATAACRAVPDRVLIELYAYELVERLRELDPTTTTCTAPFWPPAMMTAADVTAHTARELLAMWPATATIVWHRVAMPTVRERMQALFGAEVFDADRYADVALDHDPTPAARHVVGLVLRRGPAVLLEHRPASATAYADRWDTPGGKVEPGETPLAAARREAREELGIAIEAAVPIALAQELDPTSGQPFVHHVFAVQRWQGTPGNHENQRLAWRAAPDVAADPRVHPLAAHCVTALPHPPAIDITSR